MTLGSSYTTSLGITPAFRITKGDVDLTSNFEDRLISMTVTLPEGGGDGDRVEITLDDRDAGIGSPSTDETNPTVLAISLGYRETVMYSIGTFQANETTYTGMPRSMTILGSAFGFTNAGKAPVITAHDSQTLGQIINSIAASAGVNAAVSPDLASQQIPYLNQHESSLHLLQELERRFDGLAKFSNGYLSFTSRGTGQNVSGQSVGTFVLGPQDFGSWSITESSRSSYSKVRAAYFDKVQHALVWLNSTTSAANDSSVPFMLRRAYNSQVEAQAAANAMMGQLNRGQKQGTITLAKGDPSIRSGQGFAISGIRDGVDGSYVASIVTHTLDRDNGIQTTIQFYDPGTGVDFSSQQLQDGDEPDQDSYYT